jgi:hypothetical protein
MDQRLVTELRSAARLSKQEAAAALVSAFTAMDAGPHAVRAARNGFSAIRTKARRGTPQLIGLKPKHMTVVVSLSDLIDLVQVAAKGQSFGEALDEAGFKPVSGKKIVVREGLPPEPLVRRRYSKGAGGE